MKRPNKIINYCLNHKSFYLMATKNPIAFCGATGAQYRPLYNYTDEGELVCSIPDADWEIERVNAHYHRHWGKHFEEAVGAASISTEDMLPYAYAVLHDPVYRYERKDDHTRRELPHLPLYRYFGYWAGLGRKLLDLHANFMIAAPYPLKRNDSPKPPNEIMLRANTQNREQGIIQIDNRTTISGIPEAAWRHKIGNRRSHSALEWVLNEYKWRTPLNESYPDQKERIIDLLTRICAVSVETMEVVDGMAYWQDGNLIVFDNREQDDFMKLSLENWAEEDEEEESDKW